MGDDDGAARKVDQGLLLGVGAVDRQQQVVWLMVVVGMNGLFCFPHVCVRGCHVFDGGSTRRSIIGSRGGASYRSGGVH